MGKPRHGFNPPQVQEVWLKSTLQLLLRYMKKSSPWGCEIKVRSEGEPVWIETTKRERRSEREGQTFYSLIIWAPWSVVSDVVILRLQVRDHVGWARASGRKKGLNLLCDFACCNIQWLTGANELQIAKRAAKLEMRWKHMNGANYKQKKQMQQKNSAK